MIGSFLRRTPFFRAVIPYAAGIFLSGLLTGIHSVYLFWSVLLMFMIAWLIGLKGGFRRNELSGLAFNIFFFVSGLAIYNFHKSEPHFSEAEFYMATVLESPDERPKSYRVEMALKFQAIDDTVLKANENIIAYFAKTDSAGILKPGDQIIFFRAPQLITNDKNPYSFDYKSYINRRGIYRQVWLPDASWKKTEVSSSPGLRVVAEKVRDNLLEIYRKNGLLGDEFAILSALTLGYRKSLDPEVRQTFANSGAMHVLAVSGLHVGIIFLAFRLLFSFMKRSKWGRVGYMLLAIILLWSYAYITGLSPSVQRAAFMFSLVQIGDSLRRPANIYNTLAASAMILLLVNPSLLFEVGFQLSYSAVLGIIYFQPKLEKLADFKHFILRKAWSLFTVSVAAQIGTFAISAFYFKQFPVWFWISNFVVIPAAFILIVLAALILLFSFIPVLSALFTKIAGFAVSIVYTLLKFIEELPFAVYSGFNFNWISLMITSVLLIVIILFIESRKKTFLFAALGLVVAFIFSSAIIRYVQNMRNEMIVYNHREPIIHLISGRRNYLVVPDNVGYDISELNPVTNVVKARRLKPPTILTSDSFYEDNYILISGNLIFFMGRIILYAPDRWQIPDKIYFDYIIDFSNSFSYSKNSEKTTLITNSKRGNTGLENIYVVGISGAFLTNF